MAGLFSFRCRTCEEIHEGAPSFSFESPYYWHCLSNEEKLEGELGEDLCEVKSEVYFVRTCLEVPITGYPEPFLWGVWVSFSEENFTRYSTNNSSELVEEEYFGWFNSKLPYYPDTINLKTLVHPRAHDLRPYLELEPTDHPLAVDFREGISFEKAQEIAEEAYHYCGNS